MLVKKQGNVLSKTVEVLGAFDSMRATEVRITLKMNKVQGIYTVARCTHTKEGKNRMRKRLHQSPTHLKKKTSDAQNLSFYYSGIHSFYVYSQFPRVSHTSLEL